MLKSLDDLILPDLGMPDSIWAAKRHTLTQSTILRLPLLIATLNVYKDCDFLISRQALLTSRPVEELFCRQTLKILVSLFAIGFLMWLYCFCG